MCACAHAGWCCGCEPANDTAHNSAVSRKFTPRAIAASIISNDKASSHCSPNVMVPRHTMGTCVNDIARPSVRHRMPARSSSCDGCCTGCHTKRERTHLQITTSQLLFFHLSRHCCLWGCLTGQCAAGRICLLVTSKRLAAQDGKK